MRKPLTIFKILTIISVTSCFLSILISSQQTFAAAGSGSSIGGGGCSSSYDETWDTCFGGTWRYYSLDEAFLARDRNKNNRTSFIKYDRGSDSLLIPDAADKVSGGLIHSCATENSSGFFKFGLDVYSQSAGKSRDYHAGLVQKGNIPNVVDKKPSAIASPKITTIALSDAEIPAFISNLSPNTAFSDIAMQQLFEYVERKGAHMGFTWNDPTLAWFCSGVFEDGGFSSQSHVRINQSPYANSGWIDRASADINFTAQSGETIPVTFSHDMKYDGAVPNPSTIVKKDWSYQLGVTGATVTVDPSSAPDPAPNLNPFTPTNNNPVTVVPTHTYNVTLPTVISGQQTVTVCERITFFDKTFNGTNWTGGESYSKACAEITVSATAIEPPITACPLPDSSFTINKGGTQAASGVRNMSVGNTWQQTSPTNSTAVVWAKPGDTVQFRHTLCFGAQAVRGSNNPGGNGSSSPNRSIIPSVGNKATITAFTTPATSGNNYLFGKTLTGINTQAINLTPGSAQPSAVSNADERGDYFFTFYSPSQKQGKAAGETYECSPLGTSFLPFEQNGYQIPGFGTKSKCEKIAASDVGKIVEQDLDWTDVKSWVNTYSSGGSGSCSCNDSSAGGVSTKAVEYNGSAAGVPGTHVRNCYSTGSCGPCCNEYCTSLCHTQYNLTDYWYYPIRTTTATGATQKAQVKIPFNYKTSLSVSIDAIDNNIVFAGEDSNAIVDLNIDPRDNPDVPSVYATITKPSTFEVVAFTVPASYTVMPSKLYGDESFPGSASKDACSYYGISGGRCQTVRRENNQLFNSEGNLKGSQSTLLSASMNIPDIEVGWKYCVAAAVFPSNSHNNTSKPLTNAVALDANNTNSWHYSKASCVTIAKKPSVQFHNSDLSVQFHNSDPSNTKISINTSMSKKNTNPDPALPGDPSYNLRGNNIGCSFSSATKVTSGNCGLSENNKNRRVFGSWAEYSVVAKGEIKNFASGAAFGYERNSGGSYATPGGYPNVNYDAPPNVCTYSTQTFNNKDCDTTQKTIGLSKINPATISLDRLLARYTDSNVQGHPSQPNGQLDLDLKDTCILGTDGKYSPSKNGNYTCLNNGSKYVKITGNAQVSEPTDWHCMTPGSNHDSHTTVIDVTGTLTINASIAHGELSGSGTCTASTYTNIAELPQMLIFAKNINITGKVSNVDAWLIADKGNGTINTCSDVASYTSLDADVCDRQLKINGPVFAGKLLLNRTFGAGVGHASILPAEIFNLRSDVYYWAYNQAQRFSQSVTVYSREIAPRY